jgi:hypothetical protein
MFHPDWESSHLGVVGPSWAVYTAHPLEFRKFACERSSFFKKISQRERLVCDRCTHGPTCPWLWQVVERGEGGLGHELSTGGTKGAVATEEEEAVTTDHG